MIRKMRPCDLERVMKIWLEGNCDAHPFVPQGYWQANAPEVRRQLLQAEVFVWEEDGAVLGFAGMQEDYLAGIFVDRGSRSKGVGKQLLDAVKETHDFVSLCVYVENRGAVRFYLREGLTTVAEGIDELTGNREYTMRWNRICYRNLCAGEVCRELFSGFIRHQTVTKCWRQEAGAWVIREDPFVDDWTEADYSELLALLRDTLVHGGFVYGAFCRGVLKGFVSVAPNLFGGTESYLDMTNLHVSEDFRRKGIGTALFCAASAWAGSRGARKLYISAHSAVETQAFYRKMGCVPAAVICQRHVEEEPFDCQLEYKR